MLQLQRISTQFRVTRRWFSSTNRLFVKMAPTISLNDEERRLRQLLLDVTEYIGTETEFARPQLRFAGGWVRDKLLGSGSQDIDIAVDNMTGVRFAEHMKEFADRSPKASNYGEDIVKKITKIAARPEQSKHLETATLTVFGLDIDIANLRKEVYDDASRNPQMEFGTAKEDALRRDSTINALFYNLQDEQVEDLTKLGLEDMSKNVIRTPLDPFSTFKDDPLRILRCIRFASRLGFRIEDAVVQAMAIPDIREALRVKITRERIGVEMEKIFKGPRVMSALRYMEDANLYPIVFSNPAWSQPKPIDLTGWRPAYEMVDRIFDKPDGKRQALQDIQNWLVVTKDEEALTWISAALVPYSPLISQESYVQAKKGPKTLPALVVREGLKVDNHIRDTIDAAYSRVSEMIELKDVIIDQSNPSSPRGIKEGKKRTAPVDREEVGMLFHDWGVSWRATVIAALLSEMMQSRSGGLDSIVDGYHTFLTWVAKQDLLDAHNLKPLVDGRRLSKEVGKGPGPWMKEGVRLLLRWQFRNPGVTDATAGIAEVVARYG